MLVITRKEGQSFTIGDHCIVQVVEVMSARRVRIGVTAPRSLGILREEHFTPEEWAVLRSNAEAMVEGRNALKGDV
jgi:carbon storage regulator CsrA